jgi:hypothetical protein
MSHRKVFFGVIASMAAIAGFAREARAWDPNGWYIVGYNMDGTVRCRSGGCGCFGYTCLVCCQGSEQE